MRPVSGACKADGHGRPCPLHGCGFEQLSFRCARQCGSVLGSRPHNGREEVSERGCGVNGVEVEVDNHVVGVIDRALDPLGAHACVPSRVIELSEGLGPGFEVRDGVLDAKRHHVFDGTQICPSGTSQEAGISGAPSAYGSAVSVATLCATHDDARQLRIALLAELRQVVGFDAFAWLLTDPETEVGTSPIADVPCLPDLPRLIRLKYATIVNRWTHQPQPVSRLHHATNGRLGESLLWRELLADHGVSDVASMVFRDRFGCWSFLDLWRIGGQFAVAEADMLDEHTEVITEALRRCVARTFAESSTKRAVDRSGPIVLVLSADLEVRAQTPDTEQYLRALVPPDDDRRAIPAAAYNVCAQLLAVEAGVDDHAPVARVHLGRGDWLTLRAARIGDDIAVSIETSSPADRLSLFSRSAALTTREAQLVHLLADGADTRALAQQMFLSEHTVQDHLKSIFTKTGTHSRREVLSRATGS